MNEKAELDLYVTGFRGADGSLTCMATDKNTGKTLLITAMNTGSIEEATDAASRMFSDNLARHKHLSSEEKMENMNNLMPFAEKLRINMKAEKLRNIFRLVEEND